MMVMLCLSGLIAGAAFGLFARALAFVVGMTAYSLAMTFLVAISGTWSLGTAFFGFVGVTIAFQAGYMLVAGLRFALSTAATRHTAPLPGPASRRLTP